MKKFKLFILLFGLIGSLKLYAVVGEGIDPVTKPKEYLKTAEKSLSEAKKQASIYSDIAKKRQQGEIEGKEIDFEQEKTSAQNRQADLEKRIKDYKDYQEELKQSQMKLKIAKPNEVEGIVNAIHDTTQKIQTTSNDINQINAKLNENKAIIEQAKRKYTKTLAGIFTKPTIAEKPTAGSLNKADTEAFSKLVKVSALDIATTDLATKKWLKLNTLAKEILKAVKDRSQVLLGGDEFDPTNIDLISKKLIGQTTLGDTVTKARRAVLFDFDRMGSEFSPEGKNSAIRRQRLEAETATLNDNYKKIVDAIKKLDKKLKSTTVLPDSLDEALFPKRIEAEGDPGAYDIEDYNNYNNLINKKIGVVLKGTSPKRYNDLKALAVKILTEAKARYEEVMGEDVKESIDRIDVGIKRAKAQLSKSDVADSAYDYGIRTFYDQVIANKKRLGDVKALNPAQKKSALGAEFDALNKRYSEVMKAIKEYDKKLGTVTTLPDQVSISSLESFADKSVPKKPSAPGIPG